MLRNCFIFILIFLFPFQVHFKGEEEPRFIYQIQQIERDKCQQESSGFFAHCQTIDQQQNQRKNHLHHFHGQIEQQHLLRSMPPNEPRKEAGRD